MRKGDTKHGEECAHLDALHRITLLCPFAGFLDDISSLLNGDGRRGVVDKLHCVIDTIERLLCAFELDGMVQLLIDGEIVGLGGRIESDCGVENSIVGGDRWRGEGRGGGLCTV